MVGCPRWQTAARVSPLQEMERGLGLGTRVTNPPVEKPSIDDVCNTCHASSNAVLMLVFMLDLQEMSTGRHQSRVTL